MKNTQINNNMNRQHLLNILFKAGSYKGCPIFNVNSKNKPYIYGIRKQNSIINLDFTINNLKRVFNILKYFIKKDGKILLVNSDSHIHLSIDNSKNITYLNKKWERGLLTRFIEENDFDIIVLLSINEDDSDILLNESLIKKKPVISLLNIDNKNLNKILYPIFGDNNIKSSFIFLYLFKKIFFLNKK